MTESFDITFVEDSAYPGGGTELVRTAWRSTIRRTGLLSSKWQLTFEAVSWRRTLLLCC